MTDEDLQLLAKRFAEENDNDPNHKDFAEMYALKVLQWMGKTFAMVPKDFLCEYYNSQKRESKELSNGANGLTTIQRGIHQVRMGTLEILFGKELFTDTEQ